MPCPPNRTLIATQAAHDSWAKTADRAARTAPARAALRAKFEREVDPDGVLDPAERARRAESARKDHYTRLARLSAAARHDKAAEHRDGADKAPAAVTEPLDEYVCRIVAEMPPLTDEQCARVADLLRGAARRSRGRAA